LHSGRAARAAFDHPNLVSCAGLVPVPRLAELVDLAGLVAGRVRPDLSTRCEPPLLPGAGRLAHVDVDSLLRRAYGPAKQGATFGHAKVGGYMVKLP
jgi:hypothetical protein